MQAEAQVQQVSHEAERVARLPITLIACWVLGFAAVLCVVAVLVFDARSSSLDTQHSALPTPQPGPELSDVRLDLFGSPGAGQALQLRQRKRLTSYGWVNREQGVVRIPIDVAIDLELAERSR